MADKDGLKIAKDYHVNEAFANQGGFYVKGANNLDWGMKKHLSNIFDPKSGNTVMFAFDHGYFMGSTAGLERLDLLLPQLARTSTASWARAAPSAPASRPRSPSPSPCAAPPAPPCFRMTSPTRSSPSTSRRRSA